MKAIGMSNTEKMPLDYIFETYWDDFQSNRPIDGGIAYESQLRKCNLNGSLDSLKELDTLLTTVRKDIHDKFNKSGKKLTADEKRTMLFQQEKFRKFMLLIGFYFGRVLSKVYKSQVHFINQQHLKQIDERFASNDFMYFMAVKFVDDNKQHYLNTTKVQSINKPWLFFVFEPIATRLFASFDYQIESIQGKKVVADGLHRAALERLPEVIAQKIKEKSTFTKTPKPNTLVANTVDTINSSITKVANTSMTAGANSRKIDLNIESSEPEQRLVQNGDRKLTHSDLDHTQQKIQKDLDKSDMFLDLFNELDILDFQQTQGDDLYQQAKKVMAKFDQVQNNKQDTEIKFTDAHIKVQKDALQTMKKASDLGHTTATMHLAIYSIRGDWMEKNPSHALTLFQKAAEAQDPRAMKILSRLYYQGEGTIADIQLGKYWLDQAAKAGHPEAQKISKHMQLTQLMIDDRQKENKSDKTYIYFFIGFIIFTLLAMIFF